MNTSRFEVPLELPTPHFDDERTVATARQVTPIGRTKLTENWRKVRMLLPLIVLAMFCGGLGAAAVNYYEDRQRGQPVIQPVYTNSDVQLKAEASPVAVAVSATPTPDVSDKSSGAVSAEVKAESTPAAEPQTKVVTEPAGDKPSDKPAAIHEDKATDADATRITRKRRVNPPDDDAVRSNKKGAGRIADIFSGPNPQ
jgi:hypothetical protein